MAPALVAIIPARAGSKSIPGKNRRPIGGRPLAEWVIRAAIEAEAVDAVVVATDDAEVAAIARANGAEVFDRSAASATDTAPTEAVLAEVLAARDAEDYVLLQATSPLTTGADIDAAVALYRDGEWDSVVSVAPQTRFIWSEDATGLAQPGNYDPAHRPRRQDCAPLLVENGAIYVSSRSVLRATGSRIGVRPALYRMSPDTYHELDEPEDWDVIAAALTRRRETNAGFAAIRLVLTDVDGVLTDNGMYWSSDGSELKRFSARDGKGFELLRLNAIATGLITSESQPLVARRGEKLGCHAVVLGSRDKVADADGIRSKLGLSWEQVAFVGDDIHDVGLMQRAGVSFAPGDATAAAQAAADHVCVSSGGHGAFREVADLLLAAGARG